jgi:hypothetical protein
VNWPQAVFPIEDRAWSDGTLPKLDAHLLERFAVLTRAMGGARTGAPFYSAGGLCLDWFEEASRGQLMSHGLTLP